MITCGTKEMIQVRIVELDARRNGMRVFIMNQKLLQQAGIIDKQIDALQAILDTDRIPEIES